jgi:hypothetical protein
LPKRKYPNDENQTQLSLSHRNFTRGDASGGVLMDMCGYVNGKIHLDLFRKAEFYRKSQYLTTEERRFIASIMWTA